MILNNIEWYIEFVSPNHPMLMRSDESYALGACDRDSHTIYINKCLTNFMLKKVLCHEITHAAMFSYNININVEQEELIADFVATYGEEIVDITNFLFNKIRERLIA